ADDDLARLVIETVLALKLAGDRGLEFRNAVDRGVLRRLAAFDRLDRGALDVLRRVEIWLPCPQSDHVTAGGFERTRLIRHRDGGGRLDALERFFKQGHENLRLGRELRNRRSRGRQASIAHPHTSVMGVDTRRPSAADRRAAKTRLKPTIRHLKRVIFEPPAARLLAATNDTTVPGRTP